MSNQKKSLTTGLHKRYVVENAVVWDNTHRQTLYKLVSAGTEGTTGIKAKIGTLKGLLQRRSQTHEWTKNDNQRIKEYLYSILKGNAPLDFFTFVPIDLVIKSLKARIEEAPDTSSKESIREILKLVNLEKSEGIQLYLTDGQNRLFEALTPFFSIDKEKAIPFGDELPINISEINSNDEVLKPVNLAGKYFKDLDKGIQEFIENIEVPLAEATKGDLTSFVEALIAKNSGVAWTEWQKVRTEHTFTKYYKQIKELMEEPEEGGLLADHIFPLLGSSYEHEKDGWEKFISEMLIWMDSQVQPKKDSCDSHIRYFLAEDSKVISENNVVLLKKYLREFAKTKPAKGKGIDMQIRNYVMFRFALEKSYKFPKIALPNWKILKPVEFAAQFRILHNALYKRPNAYTVYVHPFTNKTTKHKTPFEYPWACSEYAKEQLECRLKLLAEVFIEKQDLLINNEVVLELKDEEMPSKEELYDENPTDYKGNFLQATQIVKKDSLFEKGHLNVPKSVDGNDSDIGLQKFKSNRSYGDTPVTTSN